MVAIVTGWFGPLDGAEAALAPVRALSPVVDLAGPIPYVALQSMLDDAVPHGLPRYWKSGYFTELPAPVLASIADGQRPQADADLGRAVLPPARRRRRGSVRRTRPSPIARRRGTSTRWRSGSSPSKPRLGSRGPAASGTRSQPSSNGVYVNHLDADDKSRVAQAYGPNYERLVSLKQKYDPDNFFRSTTTSSRPERRRTPDHHDVDHPVADAYLVPRHGEAPRHRVDAGGVEGPAVHRHARRLLLRGGMTAPHLSSTELAGGGTGAAAARRAARLLRAARATPPARHRHPHRRRLGRRAGRPPSRRRGGTRRGLRVERRARRVPGHAVHRPGRRGTGAVGAVPIGRRVRGSVAGQRPWRQRRAGGPGRRHADRGGPAGAAMVAAGAGRRRPRGPHRDVADAGHRPRRPSGSTGRRRARRRRWPSSCLCCSARECVRCRPAVCSATRPAPRRPRASGSWPPWPRTWPPRSSALGRPVTRFALDRGARRLDGGRALLAGSPLRLFRLTDRGTAVVDAVERGDDVGGAGARRGSPIACSMPAPSIRGRRGHPGPALTSPWSSRCSAPRSRGLVAGLGPVAEVVVVDDGSRAAARRRSPEPAWCGDPPTAGPAAARNLGLAAVATPLVAFVDADTTVPARLARTPSRPLRSTRESVWSHRG